MQRQHQHAEHVFPEERRREEIAAEDLFLPDGAGDHDGVERQRLDDDRRRRGGFAFSGREIAQHENQADEKDEELHGREHALDEGPNRRVAAAALVGRIQRSGNLRPVIAHARFLAPHCFASDLLRLRAARFTLGGSLRPFAGKCQLKLTLCLHDKTAVLVYGPLKVGAGGRPSWNSEKFLSTRDDCDASRPLQRDSAGRS